MKESSVEAIFAKRVRDLGGRSYKFVPADAGNPDRIVLLPGYNSTEGRVFFVELKAVGGKLRPDQVLWHRRAAEIGVTVIVLEGADEVLEWADAEQKQEAA